jgi:hypothetical protein
MEMYQKAVEATPEMARTFIEVPLQHRHIALLCPHHIAQSNSLLA